MTVLRIIREVLLCVCLAVLSMAGVTVAHVAARLVDQAQGLPTLLDSRIASVQADLVSQIDAARFDMTRQIAAAHRDVTRLTERSAERLVATVEARGTVLDTQIEAIGGTVQRLGPVIAHAEHIAANASETSDLLLACESNANCLANRTIGTLQAVERAAQAAERTARTVDAAMPVVIADVEAVTASSVQASQSTAGLMNNLEKQSRPLPLLLRFAPQAVQAVLLGIGVLK